MAMHKVGMASQLVLEVAVPNDHPTPEQLQQAVQAVMAQIPKSDRGFRVSDLDETPIPGAMVYPNWDVDGNLTGIYDFDSPPPSDPTNTIK